MIKLLGLLELLPSVAVSLLDMLDEWLSVTLYELLVSCLQDPFVQWVCCQWAWDKHFLWTR